MQPSSHCAGSRAGDDVFSRLQSGKNVRVPPLADAIGVTAGALYKQIREGAVASVAVGRAVLVPAHEARRLLGMPALEAA